MSDTNEAALWYISNITNFGNFVFQQMPTRNFFTNIVISYMHLKKNFTVKYTEMIGTWQCYVYLWFWPPDPQIDGFSET